MANIALGHIEEHLLLVPDELLHNIKRRYEVKCNRLQPTAHRAAHRLTRAESFIFPV